ncbi:MAG: polyribonucleotide nucleotidyltransferase [Bacteroidetes bacterium]|nr:polyribonucleotide nucleotidyltransferase [Bacteroidota bacterium]
MDAITKTFDIGEGREVTIETGKLAKQADGSVVVKMGNTMLLAAVVSNKEAGEGVDFLPLTVDYKEKYASVGRFPGGFFKREARPSDYEVLICRLVDRVIRPLFPDDYHANTQLVINLISYEQDTLPDALAALAASAALSISDIPFNGPISEVRVARVEGKLIINPTISQLENADLDIMVGASEKDISMVEGEMSEISEADMIEAIKFAHEAIKVQCKAQVELAKEVRGDKPNREYDHEVKDDELKEQIHKATYDEVYKVAAKGIANKHERSDSFKQILEDFLEKMSEEEREKKEELAGRYYHDVEKEAVRRCVLDTKKRLDGRATDEIRPIWSEIEYLPGTHGSAIFTRGETQALCTITLGSKMDEQIIDGAVHSGKQDFILHYNFPSFSTGEARPNRGTSRREIGHGNLALRALKHVIPTEDNPYTIRIVSDILESNGSSSMATVCGGSLALMDAGVQIKTAVSGIAMGLITDDQGNYAILSDILGDEDHLGDMDFKVTGTAEGITACQMDIKVDGLSYDVLAEALEQARKGRMHILAEMEKTISEPREDYKPHAPRIVQLKIPKDTIGTVIGPGGKVIQEIQATTGATIFIEEEGEWGLVDISSPDKDSIEAAVARIRGLTAQAEEGEVYEATVKSIMPYGAFVEFLPGKEGLLHISEVSYSRIENMDEVMKVGDSVKVKLLAVDKQTGKYKLSRKVLLPRPSETKEAE